MCASRDMRGFCSGNKTGDRAEMSYNLSVPNNQMFRSSIRTKDLLYESNDSREILNGSFSLKTLRWLLLVVLRDDDVQKLRRSLGGDGGTKTPESLISVDACESTFVGKW